MIISGLSGNEIWCVRKKGYDPGELVVGNSVCSLGLAGGIGAQFRTLAGGEIANLSALISEGRHAAIARMHHEAERQGAAGITGVVSELRHLAGYTEFLSQGTALHAPRSSGVFSTAASGIELYTHLDCGYVPVRFSMGTVAYSLGLGRGILGSLRTLGRGEVSEFSQMYNEVRHVALERLEREAAELGADAVVDVHVQILPIGPGSVEFLLTGTASRAPQRSSRVITSELSGTELWSLADAGQQPVRLVMQTCVYSVGVAAGLQTLVQGLSRGELPELTSLIYEAREVCLDRLRAEAEQVGGEHVIGNRLSIRELAPGLLEIVALGTAVRSGAPKPQSPILPPQAVISDRRAVEEPLDRADSNVAASAMARTGQAGKQMQGCMVFALLFGFVFFASCTGLMSSLFGGG